MVNGLHGLPELAIELGGVPLESSVAAALVSLTVTEQLSAPARCELAFEEPDAPLGRDGIAPGTALCIRVANEESPLFTGEVTGLEFGFGPGRGRRLLVRAHDRLNRLLRRQTVRAHIDASLESLAREMGGDVGLGVDCHGATPSWRYLVNERSSDLEFLADRAQRAGFYLTVRGETLHLCGLEGMGEPVILTLGESLLEARFDVGSEPPCEGVSVLGWDALGVRPTRGSVEASGVPARVADWFDGGDAARWTVLDGEAESDQTAERAAQALADTRAAREMIFRGVAVGQANLHPGTCVRVQGVAASLPEDYVLTAVVHTVDAATGFQSELSTAPPRSRVARTASRLTLGHVTRVDDPASSGRVKARLLSFGDIESDWMHVLSMGAGAKKGFAALPDVSDTVLIALTHEDPARGVVLGGLYGEGGPVDAGVEGNAVKRFAVLMPGGNALRLDDEKGTMRMENGDGSYLELSPDRVRLFANRDLILEAPGRSVVITGDSIDFRRG